MECWMLVLGNIKELSEEMANGIAHAVFGFHPTNKLAPSSSELEKVFRPLLFTEKKWVNFDRENQKIGYLFKVKPDEDTMIKLGKLFAEVFHNCTLELQPGIWQE